MAGLFLVQAGDRTFAHAVLSEARAQFARHGFSTPFEASLAGWHLLHAPHIIGGPESLLVEGDDLVAVAGTLTCDGAMGRPALQALLAMEPLDKPDWSRLGGQFVALVRKNGRSVLFTDYFGSFQVFHDCDRRVFSTTLLSAAKALPRLSLDIQNVYEWALNEASLGTGTPIAELKRLGPDTLVELGSGEAVLHDLAKPLPNAPFAMKLADRVAAHRQQFDGVLQPYVRHFKGRVFCPLSGGIDSRLLLAALRANGCTPEVYVYGPEHSSDVQIAKAIGRKHGFPVEWVDKRYRAITPDAFADQVERNFHDFDGLPNFGGLFENGGQAFARDRRHAGGALAASGGCGEVYRNFFFLPDRAISAASVARAFFARYTLGDLTAAFDEPAFLRAIEDKILAALGVPGERAPLPRAMIEQVYPRVRCHALFGKEISDEGRHGAYLMPFLDHRVVAAGIGLPMRLKNAGRFEAALLNAIDPALAGEPSAYGHDFSGAPSLRHRFSEWSTRARPVWLRQRSYAIQRRLGPMEDDHGGVFAPEYLGRVIDLDFPVMRRFFNIERIKDRGLVRRIACLEYFAAHFGSRLVH